MTLATTLPPGNVLVIASDRSGTLGTCLRLLGGADPRTQNLLAITYGQSPEEFVGNWRRHIGVSPAAIGVVNVGQSVRSAAGASAASNVSTWSSVRSVPDAVDLDGVIDLVEEYLDEWRGDARRTVVYLDSLTAILDHVTADAAVDFFDDLGAVVRNDDATGFVRMSTDQTCEVSASAFETHADAVLDLSVGDRVWEHAVPLEDHSPEPRDRFSVDDALQTLAVRRRRLALYYLCRNGETPLRELGEGVAARETDSGDQPTPEDVERVCTSLHSCHLPKLVDVGVVSYDDNQAALVDRSSLEPFLTLAADRDHVP